MLSRYQQTALWTLLGLILVLPLSDQLPLDWHVYDQKRFALCLLLIVSGLLRIRRRQAPDPSQLKQVIAISSLALIAVLASPNPLISLLEWSHWVLIAGLVWVVAASKAPENAWIQVAFLSCALYLGLALLHLASAYWLAADLSVLPRLPGFSNIRFFGHWQSWTLLVIGALPYFQRQLPRVPPYWLWLVAVGWWFLFYIAAGRGPLLGIVCATLVALALLRKRSLPWLRTLLICAGLGIGLGLAWLQVESTVFVSNLHSDGGLLSDNSSGRIAIWQQSWQTILALPWHGAGPLHFSAASGVAFGSPHNLPLLLLVEYGWLLGSLILAIVLLWLIRNLAAISSASELNLNCALRLSICSALVHCLVSATQITPYGQLWLILTVGAVVKAPALETVPVPNPALMASLNYLRLAAALALAFGIAYSFWQAGIYDPLDAVSGSFFPRFWAQPTP